MALITVPPVYRLLAIALIYRAAGIPASGVQRVKTLGKINIGRTEKVNLDNFWHEFFCHILTLYSQQNVSNMSLDNFWHVYFSRSLTLLSQQNVSHMSLDNFWHVYFSRSLTLLSQQNVSRMSLDNFWHVYFSRSLTLLSQQNVSQVNLYNFWHVFFSNALMLHSQQNKIKCEKSHLVLLLCWWLLWRHQWQPLMSLSTTRS